LGKLFAARYAGVFLVENVERPKADVGNFFFIERELGRHESTRRRIGSRHGGRGGRATGERQRHAHGSQHRYGFAATLSL
jgi:hypothetical protein